MAKGRRKAKKATVSDRISELPDDILSRILSNLKTKEAVATSALSKRWECVWKSGTFNLKFSDNFPYSYSPNKTKIRIFEEYVDNVLFQFDGSEIRKCRFSCRASSHLYSWIYVVARNRIQKLTIQSTSSVFEVMDLPCSLFDCKTLVVLKIDGGFVLNLPSSFSLPNLKTLHLDSVIYVDDSSAERLFSSCPVLEALDIERKGWDGVKILTISVPSLKTLSIFYAEVYAEIDDDDYENCETKINAPNLEWLTFGDEISEDVFLYPSPSLSNVCIYVSRDVHGVFQGLQYVRELTLTNEIMGTLGDFLLDYDLPTFEHLSQLYLGSGENVDWSSCLPEILNCAPNLEILGFPEGLLVREGRIADQNFRDFNWESPEDIPECLDLSLTTVTIHRFVGVPGEVKLIKFLLESSKVLKRMMIDCMDWGARVSVSRNFAGSRNEILSCPRLSEQCEVEFINEAASTYGRVTVCVLDN